MRWTVVLTVEKWAEAEETEHSGRWLEFLYGPFRLEREGGDFGVKARIQEKSYAVASKVQLRQRHHGIERLGTEKHVAE
ncbi:hypothetical protein CLCR_05288 [Cladophialophora carrionii]|uniref:Uncharacterized protein n=1 Tax=Cladophialophora carrionii TaxID=86049 RepID=A0A1C1CLC7_9EURO|nr:hypothetical protein CLCR_05288 [Cladophialophora carrionii]